MSRLQRSRLRLLTAALYMLQPLARLCGRMERGLSPWRRMGPARPAPPRPRRWLRTTAAWTDPIERVASLLELLAARGLVLRSGGDWDRFDASISGGTLAGARLRTLVEEHGHGRQVLRVRAWPHLGRPVRGLLAALGTATVGLALTDHTEAAAVIAAAATVAALRCALESGRALRAIDHAVRELAL
jgi:hypothetical protein